MAKQLQRMLFQLQMYDLDISHCPGKDLLIVDAMSRAYFPTVTEGERGIKNINICKY